MRSLSAVSLLAGPLVLVGYAIGTLVADRRLRAERSAPPSAAGRGFPTPGELARPRRVEVESLVVEAVAVLVTATVVWRLIERVSPGSGFSRIGYFTDQVLAAWQSVSLWAAFGVIVGLAAPITRGFRGRPALGAAGAILAVHLPWFLIGAAAAAGTAMAIGRSGHVARGAAILAVLPVAWLGWVLTWQPAWGLPPGPETTVWAMCTSLVLGVRWWHDRPNTWAAPSE